MRRGPLAIALSASVAIILSAPASGQLRAAVRADFPDRFVTIVAAALAAALAVAVLVAIARIRDRRALRYLAIATALVVGVTYARAVRTGNAEVDVVERVHFIEYGMLALLFYRAWRPTGDASVFILPMLAGVLVGTLDEWWQWFIPDRVGEAHDVLLNGVAIGCGLLFAAGLDPPARPMPALHRDSVARAGLAAVIVATVFALFFQSVHLGCEVIDDDGNVFRSAYSAGDLESVARDRAQAWRVRPPVVLHRFSPEDHYLSEGWWHVQERNRAVSDGRARAAWSENRILEQFFGPVLDTPSYVSATGHRWTVEQRARAAQQAKQGVMQAARQDDGPYTSGASPYPIYAWPTSIYWMVVIGAVIAVMRLTDARAAAI